MDMKQGKVFIRHSQDQALVIWPEKENGERMSCHVENIQDNEWDLELVLKNTEAKDGVDAEAFHIFPEFAINCCYETDRVKLTYIQNGMPHTIVDYTEKLGEEQAKWYCKMIALKYPEWDGDLTKNTNAFVRNNPYCQLIADSFAQRGELTFKEAFEIEANIDLKATAFLGGPNGVDVDDMMEHLEKDRIDTKGKKVRRKKFRSDGSFEWVENDVIYELYKCNTGKITGNDSDIGYAVKCWCTTTNKHHYIFVEEAYATDALTAIASTFRVQEDVFEDVVELQRQGDIAMLKYREGFDKSRLKADAPKRALTPEEYFGLLVAET